MSVGKEKASSPLEFPAGLRVLAVDDDSTCLRVLAKMLQACGYEVTQCSRAEEALSILREGRSKFDIVISDVHMPDMDGFKLLEIICLEMDLPVVMMSADDENDVVMKGIIDGACDYLVKPVRMEAVKLIWKHVILKQKNGLKVLDQSKNVENAEMRQRQLHDESHLNSMDKENYESSNCIKEEEDEGKDKDDSASLKKPRMVWTAELHQQFVAAVNQIGLTNAVPKKILEIMNVSGLTRENVASHLQKYRLYLRRGDENLTIQQEGQQRSNAIFSSGMPLANQRNFYNCGISGSRFGMEQQLSNYKNEQANLSSGVSTMIESDDQLMPFNQFGQVSGNIDLQISDGTLDRFSSPANANCIYGNFSSSFTMQRPFKMQKLDENGNKEVFNDGAICYPVSLSPTVTDFPKGFVAKSSGHDFFPNNSANACYLGNRNSEYTSDSSYAPTLFVEHFDQDDFNIRPYEEQFVGHYEAMASHAHGQ